MALLFRFWAFDGRKRVVPCMTGLIRCGIIAAGRALNHGRNRAARKSHSSLRRKENQIKIINLTGKTRKSWIPPVLPGLFAFGISDLSNSGKGENEISILIAFANNPLPNLQPQFFRWSLHCSLKNREERERHTPRMASGDPDKRFNGSLLTINATGISRTVIDRNPQCII